MYVCMYAANKSTDNDVGHLSQRKKNRHTRREDLLHLSGRLLHHSAPAVCLQDNDAVVRCSSCWPYPVYSQPHRHLSRDDGQKTALLRGRPLSDLRKPACEAHLSSV